MQTNTLSHQDNITQEKDTLYPRSFLHHNSTNSAFIEELALLESMQDNLNYIGEILKIQNLSHQTLPSTQLLNTIPILLIA
ncbi:hypothetical protein [Helicobacter rappini]|uniref:hypothetical protein n=1 Tax=Helicobacter rappini TaxID=95150 RepID=UPI000CF016AA|nr:hypothetical protein [Helicobacter rappini]